jgi:hypothetical protein
MMLSILIYNKAPKFQLVEVSINLMSIEVGVIDYEFHDFYFVSLNLKRGCIVCGTTQLQNAS